MALVHPLHQIMCGFAIIIVLVISILIRIISTYVLDNGTRLDYVLHSPIQYCKLYL